MNQQPRSEIFRTVLSLLPLALPAAPSLANPSGGQVAAGRAAISQQGARMDIHQSTQRAVINWQSFSIDRGEHVHFDQPGATAATLNRVVGNDPSAILGRMTANGQVVLVNQNGILVGKDAKINVGSLIASTANLGSQDFMAGRMDFREPGKPGARIVNDGHIDVAQGGLVALVAPGVENHGAIQARLGKVALASGERFTLDPYGDELVKLTLSKEQLARMTDAQGRPLSHHVSNTGEIIADGGIVTLRAGTGRQVVDSQINLEGRIQARSVGNHNGVIALLGDDDTEVKVAGTLDASGTGGNTDGGRVEIRAGDVQLAQGAKVDVSGDRQGGAVLVGGDFQGKGGGVRAHITNIDRNAAIAADSRSSGDGGKVIVWSEDATRFEGKITARGGRSRGNGGLVEVSGKRTLGFDGDVDARAPRGKAGSLLLDPGDLTVARGETVDLPPSGKYGNTGPQDQIVNVDKVNFLLQNGTNVSLQASRDLNVQATIDGRCTGCVKGADLSLTGGRNVYIGESILTNDGAILARALTGNLTMAAGKALSSGNAPITLAAGQNLVAQHLLSAGAIGLTAGGTIEFAQSLAGVRNSDGSNQGIGSLTANAQGGVNFNGVLAKNGVQISSAGHLNVNRAIVSGGPVVLSAASILVHDNATIDTRGATQAAQNALTLRAQNDVILNADLVTRNANLSVASARGSILAKGATTLASGMGQIRLWANRNLSLGNLTTQGQVLLTAETGSFASSGVLSAANLTLTSAGNIALKDVCVAQGLHCGANATVGGGQAGALVLRTASGDITHTGTLITDRDLTVEASNGKVSLKQVEVRKQQAALSVQAKHDITFNGDLLTRDNGTQTITSQSGNITFNGGVLATGGGLNVAALGTQTNQGAVTFNRPLGFAAGSNAGADPRYALGALNVRAGGLLTVHEAVEVRGNANACTPGADCSLKLIQTGDRDIVVKGRLHVASGNVLIGKEGAGGSFGDGKIRLGNSIYADGTGSQGMNSVVLNGNVVLTNSGKNDQIISFRTKNITINGNLYHFDKNNQDSDRDFDPNTRINDIDAIKNEEVNAGFYKIFDGVVWEVGIKADQRGRPAGPDGKYTLAQIEKIRKLDQTEPGLEIPAVIVRAPNGKIEFRGQIAGLKKAKLALQILAKAAERDTGTVESEDPAHLVYYDESQKIVLGLNMNTYVDDNGQQLTSVDLRDLKHQNIVFSANPGPEIRSAQMKTDSTGETGAFWYQLGSTDGGVYTLTFVDSAGPDGNANTAADNLPLFQFSALNLEDIINGGFPPSIGETPQNHVGSSPLFPPISPGGTNPFGAGNGFLSGGTGIPGAGPGTPNPDTGGSLLTAQSAVVANQTLGQADQSDEEEEEKKEEESQEQEGRRIVLGGRGVGQEADLGRASPETSSSQVFGRKYRTVCGAGDVPNC